MKKKTAITLGALALLAGGVTFGGITIKEKKEKDKIEKELNKLLVSEAEEELSRLADENSVLLDSIAYYDDIIQGLTPDTLISKSDADTLRQLVSSMHREWQTEYDKFMDKYWKVGYEGDGSFNEELLPKVAQKKMRYLNGGMLKKYHDADEWERKYCEYKEFVYYGGDSDDKPYVHFALRRVLHMLDEIEYLNNEKQAEKIEQLEVFVDNIDNSQGVIKQNTLAKMKKLVKDLSSKGNLKQKKDLKQKKTSFESAQKSINYKMSRSRDKVKLLRKLQHKDY